MTDELLTTGQIANRWGCSQEFVRYLIRRGKLHSIEHLEKRTHYRICMEEVLRTENEIKKLNAERYRINLIAKMAGINRKYVKPNYLDEGRRSKRVY